MKTLLLLLAVLPGHAAPKSPVAVIDGFYRKYLGTTKRERLSPPQSASFLALRKEDAAACKKFAEGDICGYGTDGDPYLDAQDYDTKLTYASSGFKAVESAPGKVTATFNVFPHDPANAAESVRTVVYAMVQEKGAWVVDDVVTGGSSARQRMRDEIDLFRKNKDKAKK